jgi:hypothetical protein
VANLIIGGNICLKQGTEPAHFMPDGLIFEDHSTLEADLVVFTTGYELIQNSMCEGFGEEIVRRTSPVWGLDKEGKPRRAYTPSGYSAMSTEVCNTSGSLLMMTG